jgi:glycosyltransferase involved in cell wall biosynthesis
VFRVKIGCDLSLPALMKVCAILKKESPDIVHTHLIHGDLYGTIGARLAGIKTVMSTKHNDDSFRKGWVSKKLNRWIARKTDAIVVISEYLKEFHADCEKIPLKKMSVIRYGIGDFSRNVAEGNLRGRLGFDESHIVIGCVARLTRQKGHVHLLDAFAIAGQQNDNMRLVIAGDGPLSGPLQEQACRLNLGAKVVFLGRREDTADLYHAFDALVLPSLWEGFGLVFLEAMSCGLPVIATRVSAIPEIVLDGETGLLVPPGDSIRLAAVMLWMAGHQMERKKMGDAGRRRAAEHFPVSAMVDETNALYRSLSEPGGSESG